MKILVIGGAGFVGSHLCESLVKIENNQVFSLDCYFTGTEKNHVDNVTYIKGYSSEISEKITIIPDLVYHFGEYSRVEQSFNDIELVNKLNISSIYHVLNFCKKNSSKLIYSGSSTKFGDGGLGRSASPYAWTKASNTELVKNYGKWFNVPYAITYFYNVYGPREIKTGKYATLIALFKEKMKNGEAISVGRTGN